MKKKGIGLNLMEKTEETIRLQVYLSSAGVCSRRGAQELLDAGRVQVNGSIIREVGYRVSELDRVTVDGKVVRPSKNKVYIALHKPSKYLCSSSDERGRSLAIDLLQHLIPYRIYNVGRLDYMTSGLIFFTNDGDFAQKILHPSKKIEKEYEVQTKKPIPEEFLKEFLQGITYQGVTYKASRYEIKGPRRIHLVLEEGKNREIRYAFESRGLYVTKVHRLRIGPVKLDRLDPGKFRELTSKEVGYFTGMKSQKASKKKTTQGTPQKVSGSKNNPRRKDR
jgi:23S rRNA pseudouridine2605 synthase